VKTQTKVVFETLVKIKTQFEAYHRWKNAPSDVQFLRNWHRHIFYVTLMVEVKHDDRDVEFFQLKRKLDAFVQEHYAGKNFELSCEMIAKQIVNEFEGKACEVSEDNENSGIVYRKVIKVTK
jgi:hypothetical protein